MSKKKEILGQIGLYSLAEQVTQLISMVAGILTRNFLGPIQMGMWSTLSLVLEYAGYSTLGTTSATAREIPYYMGKKDKKTADEVKNLVASFGTLTSSAVAVGILAYVLFMRKTLSAPLFWGLIGVSLMVVLQRFNNLLVGLLRAYKNFELASHQMLVSAVANLILIALLTYFFKIYGYVLAMILSFAFNIFYMTLRHDFDFRFMLSRKIKDLIAFGLPLMLLGFSSAIFKSIDKIVILKLLGFKAMGLYSIAILATSYLNRLPNSIGIILIPHFQERYGERDRIQDLQAYVDKAAYGLSTVMPLLIGVGWIVAQFGVSLFLPQYTKGISALKVLILSSFFFAVSLPYGDIAITLRRHMILLPITGIGIALSAVLNILAVKMGLGITGVSVMTTLTLSLYFSALFRVAATGLYSFREGIKRFGSILFRFTYLVTTLVVLDQFVRLPPLLLQTLFQLALFILSQIPFLYSLNRTFDLLSTLTSGRKRTGELAPLVLETETEN